MCLAGIAVAHSRRFPFVVASNRDEYFERPTLPMDWWSPHPGGPEILSGRDARAGGTWLGLDRRGRLALATNVRGAADPDPGLPTRGTLVTDWLAAPNTAAERSVIAEMEGVTRNGFNFVAAATGKRDSQWVSNRPEPHHRRSAAGIRAVSNADFDTSWPKVAALEERMKLAVAATDSVAELGEALFAALADRTPAAHPVTDLPAERDRELSCAFVRISDDDGKVYGTRCSTVVIAEATGDGVTMLVRERSFAADGSITGEVTEQFAI